ncbi:MAG: ccmF, partial [Acidimicrobiaceae bacterium]|nr:ccmF [Acidimicrobiaceae bacterium]
TFTASGVGPALLGLFGAIVATGVILIGWRGDRLASPGTIDSPVSREGAFLVNNLLFAAFALVVLLGTVFPLFLQAINGDQVSIGRPYFDAFTLPLSLALLFFMAIAPALPWRKSSEGVLRQRLLVPAWMATLTVVGCVAAGIRGLAPLCAFGLGAFAGASALRQLVLAASAARRHGLPLWRGVVGRANGGMVVHLGVVVIGVGLAAASSFGQSALITLRPGHPVTFDGHRLELVTVRAFSSPSRSGDEAVVRVDHGTFRPAIDVFRGDSQAVATPSVDSGLVDDVYLAAGGGLTPGAHQSATLSVFVQPLVLWLWVGGGLVFGGSLLAAVPGRRRRRPTDPSSILLPELAGREPAVAAGART